MTHPDGPGIAIPADFFKDYTSDQMRELFDSNGMLGEAECARLAKAIGQPVPAPLQIILHWPSLEKLLREQRQ